MRRSVDMYLFYVENEFMLSWDPVRKRVCVNTRVLPMTVETMNDAIEVLAAFNQHVDESDEVFNDKVSIRIWVDTDIPF